MNPLATTAPLTDESALMPLLGNRDPSAVLSALGRPRKGLRELALLLSPGADEVIEEIAAQAHRITLARFGRIVQLYAPLYVSNHCVGSCPYCGFRADRQVTRRTLTVDEILAEAELLVANGLRHILLVSGEAPRKTSVEFLCEIAERLSHLVPSISVEVPPLHAEDYRALRKAGVDGVTLYQETYDQAIYTALHDRGPKADYDFRLGALDRAGAQGIRKLTVGALWGLAPWRLEALRLGRHAAFLERTHWRSQISIGMPRLHQVPDDFVITHPLTDRALTHLVVAMRVFFEDAGIVISTREEPRLREQLVPLGVTQISAGSSTEPGGYTAPGVSGGQFKISDERPPAEMATVLKRLGYDPVFKDWDTILG